MTDYVPQVWASGATHERMPMWCPPTPPSGEGDVYCDTWARVLYRPGPAPDSLLPPVHRREARGSRDTRRARAPTRPAHAPLSLFERAGPKPRPRVRPQPPHGAHAPAPAPQPEWAASEDAALRRALRLQRLPAEPPAALAPNWDWVAELVNEAARAYRSARACRDRHDALADPERARRRHRRPPAARRRLDDDRPRPPLPRLEAMREAAERRRAAPKRRLDDPQHRNPKHAQLLADHGVEYDAPPTPMEVAARRADRIAREKLKAGTAAPAPQPATGPSTPAPASIASATPPVPPSRIVVAAPAPRADAARRARPAQAGDSPRPAPPQAQTAQPQPQAQAHLLYRHQTFPARHLKILHQTAAQPAQGGAGVVASSPAAVEGGAALRKLQLQQLALRRAGAGIASGAPATAPTAAAPRLVAAARHPHHSHVVVAQLAPQPPPHPQPQQQPQERPPRQ